MTRQCELALVVGAARSGTTLTRLLLDAHPEVGCPSEAGLPGLMSHLAQAWATVNADEIAVEAGNDPGAAGPSRDTAAKWEEPEAGPEKVGPKVEEHSFVELPAAAREWIRRTIEVPMRQYCARGEKHIYCDKSLDSVYHLPVVRWLVPEVKAILVFRHVMDTVASGIEASPWGFNAYGYGPYVQVSPGNSVAALASYWLDHVDRALRWEAEYPEQCHRVRYEDLVLQPAETVAGILRFLGVREDLSVLGLAFGRELHGPGDYKVEFTSRVHAASIGHGKRVPVSMLPPRLIEALNEKLTALEYATLDQGWNAEEKLVDGGGRGFWAEELALLMQEIQTAGVLKQEEGPSFAIVADDHRSLRWVIDANRGRIVQGDGEVNAVITGTAEDLVLLLTDQENLGVLLRSGRVRHLVADQHAQRPVELMREMRTVTRILRDALANCLTRDSVRVMATDVIQPRRRAPNS